jgi:hypothetical protein
MARTVALWVSEKGPLYTGDAAVGVLLSVV